MAETAAESSSAQMRSLESVSCLSFRRSRKGAGARGFLSLMRSSPHGFWPGQVSPGPDVYAEMPGEGLSGVWSGCESA